VYDYFEGREVPDRDMEDESYPEEEYDDSDVIGELRLPVFRGIDSDEDEDDTEEEY